MKAFIWLKRVYKKPARRDGTRVLVDRLWPRGLTKEAAAVDLWLRHLAPSNELRKRYHENREAWTLFRRQYFRELTKPEATEALQQLCELMSRNKPVTLLFASTNLEHNNAVALKKCWKERANRRQAPGRRARFAGASVEGRCADDRTATPSNAPFWGISRLVCYFNQESSPASKAAL